MDQNTFSTLLILQLLLSQLIQAQSIPPSLEPDPTSPENFTRPKEVIIIAVVATLLFVGFYFIYLCYCIEDSSISINWRPWNNFSNSSRHSRKNSNGLDPVVVKSLPIFEYRDIKSDMIEKSVFECAVCLTEFNEKDHSLRLIPKCDHIFHADCVDDWLIGHATCPICRLNLTNADIWDHRLGNDDVLDVGGDEERIMSRSRRMRSMSFSGRPRLLWRLSRSLSTGHVAVKHWESMDQRFTMQEDQTVISSSWEGSSGSGGGGGVLDEPV